MATLAELEAALVNADKAGDSLGAKKLAIAISAARKDSTNTMPDTIVPGTVPQPVEPSLGEKIVGAGEAALTLGTGMTGGTLGMIGGTLKGLAEQILSGKFGDESANKLVQQSATEGAQALTYMPRTQSGQEQAAAAGEFMQNAIPLTPFTAELGAIGQGLKSTAPVVRAVAAPVTGAVSRAAEAAKPAVAGAAKAVVNAPRKAGEALGIVSEAPQGPRPGSVGASATGAELQRVTTAEGLPVPVKLTKGAASRDAEQLAFEKEQTKNPSLGAPLRNRIEENNLQALQNFDAVIDLTGAEAPDLAGKPQRTRQTTCTRLRATPKSPRLRLIPAPSSQSVLARRN
jgi:hypothetical protein